MSGLINEVCELETLMSAWRKVRANKGMPGVDFVTIQPFESSLTENLHQLSTQLSEDRYYPMPIKRIAVKKASGGIRELGILTIHDRIVQRAVLYHLFDNLSSAKSIMPELDTISSDILTGVNACGRRDGNVIVLCCVKKGYDEITKQVREILSKEGKPLSLTADEIVNATCDGEYTFSFLGNATVMLHLMQ